ncbi:hypothetical protein [Streptomyces caeruleatus]|uniref:Uncharacterized protein n=1 Tax=Streptomyces caeruleatus TaxID=661399 RepID=A0A117RN86_9ACTN|nr:hypothetical protein [Streptomyces caeruleatus]KUO00094.1 hypothetical protein AQJ67_24885 [Streptomyces caeruleatus]
MDFVPRTGIGAALVGVVARFGEDPLAVYGNGTKVILFVTMAFCAFCAFCAFYAFRRAGGILTARIRGLRSLPALGAQPAAMTAARLTAAGRAWAKRMRRLAVAAP